LSTVRLLNAYFLMSSLLRFLNNLLECPLLPPLPISKSNDLSTLSILFMILKVCIKSLLTLLVVRRDRLYQIRIKIAKELNSSLCDNTIEILIRIRNKQVAREM